MSIGKINERGMKNERYFESANQTLRKASHRCGERTAEKGDGHILSEVL